MRNAPLVACILLISSSVFADPPVITSFDQNGVITWTNSVNTSATYRVEWSSSLVGTSVWQRSFQRLNYVEGKSNVSFTAAIPMFYRVVMETNLPPSCMVFIEPGEFEMGQADTNLALDEQPVHTNFISGFYMDKFEVSKQQWDIVRNWAITNGYSDLPVATNGWRKPSNTPAVDTNRHPVVAINWYDAVKWCNARSAKEGLRLCYYIDPIFFNAYRTGNVDIDNSWIDWTANGYRLPTEAEWEKAARGGLKGNFFPWPSCGGSPSNHIDGSMANGLDSLDVYDNGTTPVGYFNGAQQITNASLQTTVKDMANGYGLYDMSGNVWEYCNDWYGSNYYASAVYADPIGPTNGTQRAVRGGSWGNTLAFNRCAMRASDIMTDRGGCYNGLRTVRRP